MAEDNNAGSVSLGVRLDDKEFLRKIGRLSIDISKVMQDSLNVKAPTIDMRDVTSEIRSVGKEITKSLDGMGDMLYEQFSKGIGEGAVEGAVKASSAMKQFTMPKIKIDLDEGHLREQIRIYGKLWEAYDNQRIAQAQKVKRMTSELSLALPGIGREKMAADLASEQKRLVDIQLAASQADQQVVALERALEQISQPKPNPAAHAMQQIAHSAGAQAQAAVRQTTAQTKRMGAVGKQAGREISRSLNSAKKSTLNLGGAMKKTLRIGLAFMGVRSIYYGIRRAVNSVMESFKRMAAQNAAFAKTMNNIAAATDTMKGSFAAMIAPLVQALEPVLIRIVEWLTKAFNALAMFFAALAGKKTVMVAVGSTKKFTDGLGQATKASNKLKRSLAGFDELEILHPASAGAITGAVDGFDPGQQFKEVPVEIGGALGEAIEKIRSFVQKIKGFWNKEIKPLWDKVVNTAKEIWGHLEDFWDSKGDVFKSIFGDTWNYVTEKFSNTLDKIKNIFALFSGIFSGDWGKVWDSVKNIFINSWKDVENEFIFSTNNIKNLLAFFGIDVSEEIGGLQDAFSGLTKFLSGAFSGDWDTAWQGIVEIANGALRTLRSIVISIVNQAISVINTFIRLANNLGLNMKEIPLIPTDSSKMWKGSFGGFINHILEKAKKAKQGARGGITKHARGGYVQQPSLAYVGERRKKEAILPLEQNLGWADIIADKLAERGGIGRGDERTITIPIYLGTDTLIHVVELAVDREGRVRNKPVFI